MSRLRAAWCRWRYCRSGEHHAWRPVDNRANGRFHQHVEACAIPGCGWTRVVGGRAK